MAIKRSAKLNTWQRLSAASNNAVTPANLISIAGGLLIVLGFFHIINESWVLGVLLVGTGRVMDILDGYVARRTGTAGKTGAFVDVVIDKLTILLALIVILKYEIIPFFVILLIALQNVVNVVAFFIAAARRLAAEPQVLRHGKLATFYSWIAIVCFLAARGFEVSEHPGLQWAFNVLGYVFLIIFVRYGFIASLRYLQAALGSRR